MATFTATMTWMIPTHDGQILPFTDPKVAEHDDSEVCILTMVYDTNRTLHDASIAGTVKLVDNRDGEILLWVTTMAPHWWKGGK